MHDLPANELFNYTSRKEKQMTKDHKNLPANELFNYISKNEKQMTKDQPMCVVSTI